MLQTSNITTSTLNGMSPFLSAETYNYKDSSIKSTSTPAYRIGEIAREFFDNGLRQGLFGTWSRVFLVE